MSTAAPSLPARPVRPMRWMYCALSLGAPICGCGREDVWVGEVVVGWWKGVQGASVVADAVGDTLVVYVVGVSMCVDTYMLLLAVTRV